MRKKRAMPCLIIWQNLAVFNMGRGEDIGAADRFTPTFHFWSL